MDTMINEMLKKYNAESIYDKKNAAKEVMQEIVLCGLSRAGFFKKAAFYGGTALRIFYGLDRFSEDLDFSLVSKDPDFSLIDYFPVLQNEVRSLGLNVTVNEKEKTFDSNIRSAFLKGNTKEHILLFYPQDKIYDMIQNNEVIKIKFEVDVNPPDYVAFEHKYRLLPMPYEVKLYDLASLFAGKIHAVICRSWKNRVKGRDLYDYVFYLQCNAPVNLKHLRERLIQSEFIEKDAACTLDDVKQMLYTRFEIIDFEAAKEDAKPFIHDAMVLNLWTSDFFKQITDGLHE